MKIRYLFLIISLIVLSISCGTPKRTSHAISKHEVSNIDSLLDLVNFSFNHINTLSGRYTIDLVSANEETSLIANIRFKKDSSIWASVYVIAGMELFRAIVTPDSIRVIDRIHEVYYADKIQKVSGFLSTDFDFNLLSSIIIPSIRPTLENCLDCQHTLNYKALPNNKIELRQSTSQNLNFVYTIENQGKILTINYSNGKEVIEILYQRYVKIDNFLVPEKIIVKQKGTKNLKMQINNNRFELNKPVYLPFNIPKEYKKVNFDAGKQ